ncbi:glycosyltransferase family 4 protein [uncultured Methanofollis sp.]|uniref:glycosyltransferase family 4 protein n=1 Tax=uncultured Methanofollis sp. TaxID=262500 RepID=UPI0026022572|nr:glycosyltransferase family 4 protein [uncultured Methanofollis sp.]
MQAERGGLDILFIEPLKSFEGANGKITHSCELIEGLAARHNRLHIFSTIDLPFVHTDRITCSPIPEQGMLRLYWSIIRSLLRNNSSRRYDVIYTRNSCFGVLGDLFSGRLHGTPIICEVNGLFRDEIRLLNHSKPSFGISARMNQTLCRVSEHYLLKRADTIIAVTAGIKRHLIEEYGIDEKRVTVIENGANIEIFRPGDQGIARKALGLDPSAMYICFTGNFAPWQGLPDLIRAVPQICTMYPMARFLLVGDGVMRETCIELADKLGVGDRIYFTGRVAYKSVPIYVNASDVCVAPFIKDRNDTIGLSPLKVYEYMGCGKPVVASDITGVRELLKRSGGGITARPEDPEALASAVVSLLADPEKRTQMGRAGCEYVRNNNTWEIVARKVGEVCSAVASRHGQQSRKPGG